MSCEPVTQGLLLYPQVVEVLKMLAPELRAALVSACIDHYEGREADLGGDKVLEIVWVMVRPSLDRAKAAYENRSAAAQQNARKGKRER